MLTSTFLSRIIVRSTINNTAMQRIKENADKSLKMIAMLKSELEELGSQYNQVKAQQLRQENAELEKAIELAKKTLIMNEIKNGINQIPVPSSKEPEVTCSAEINEKNPVETKPTENITKVKEARPKEKKVKEPKEKAPPAPEPEVNIGRLDLRVAKVVDVQRHPDADSLYLLKINCGEEKLRTVCSGLVKFVPMEELVDRSVMLLCNLKPVKMRGITSEAMVMCASTPEKVEVLSPPSGCEPGEPVHCEGYDRNPDPIMNPKKKIFETVAPDLHTNESLQACYKGVALSIPGKGNVVAQTLKNVAVK